MFRSARLQLTAWYVIITMFVSMSFSVVIYRVLVGEVERFDRTQRARMERRFQGQVLYADGTIGMVPIQYSEKSGLVEEVENRVFILLGVINGVIFMLSGLCGYLLSGFTLRPIQRMVREQHRFVSDASHELKTPLTSLKTAFEVFLRSSEKTIEEATSVISESIEEVNSLQSLSESLLQLAQYEQPNGKRVDEAIDLSLMTKDAIRTVTPLAKQKKISITKDIEKMQIYGNKTSLTDLCVILLDNAIKYSNPNTTVRIRSKKIDGFIKLTITDEGIGIEEKDISHVFDRFFRADFARTKTNESGYGLGLSIAKKIVQAHRGTIKVSSRVGVGTTFTIKLPIHPSG